MRAAVGALLLVLAGQAAVVGAVPSGFGKNKDHYPSLKADVPHVRCQMCEATARHAHARFERMRRELPAWRQGRLKEDEIFAELEVMCDPDREAGDWITRLDIQQVAPGRALSVVEMPSVGDCRRECHTLGRICAAIVGEDDVALGELLYGAPPLDRLTNALCRGELSDACSKPPPVPPAGAREVDESFIAMDAEELRLKHMMATMQDQGMSGQVMTRDGAMRQLDEYREQLDDYGVDLDELRSGVAARSPQDPLSGGGGVGGGGGGSGSGAAGRIDLSRVGHDPGDEL